jgi:arylsulfatase
MTGRKIWLGLLATAAMVVSSMPATAQQQPKPNIILILSDDFGYGDSGPYGGGENRGMPTPSLDRLAAEGMQFMSFYAQPSCTPGRAAVQTGRIPNRSGMTTVAFQGQGGGLAGGGMDTCISSQDRRLQNLLHWQVASRRSRLRAPECAGL